MRIQHPHAFRARVDAALRSGPARVDRILFTPNISALLAVIGDDGTAYWITYDTDRAVPWVLGVRPPNGTAQIVHGAGCDATGFRLAFPHCSMVYELLALTHHPMSVVRGTDADFAQVGTL